MNKTGLDYSKYPYKIMESEFVDWEGLAIRVVYPSTLTNEEKKKNEEAIDSWYRKLEEERDKSPHFISDFEWNSDLTELSFWMDMGNTETTALEGLLSIFIVSTKKPKEIILGRSPSNTTSGKDESIMPLSKLGIDAKEYPFRIFCLWQYTSSTPFTINFTRQLNDEEKNKIEEVIYNYFTKGKEDPEEIKFFLSVKWDRSQNIGWWTTRFPLNQSTLDPLLCMFTPFKDIIKEFIIGVYLDCKRIKNYL